MRSMEIVPLILGIKELAEESYHEEISSIFENYVMGRYWYLLERG